MEEKKHYLKWCWLAWIAMIIGAGVLFLSIPWIGWILYLGFLGYILYMSVVSVGTLEAKTFVLKGTKIPVLIIKGPKIVIVPYPFLKVDYTVNLSIRPIPINDLTFYDKDGFELKIDGNIEMKVVNVFLWCYTFFGGEPLEKKEEEVKKTFGDAFQTLINQKELPIKEIEKLRGPEICGLIFKGEPIPGRDFDPEEFKKYRKNAETQGWEVTNIVFGSFIEPEETREIREKLARAAVEEEIQGRLGRARGEGMRREFREAIREYAKAFGKIFPKEDGKLTEEEKRRLSKKTPEAARLYLAIKQTEAIKETDKTLIGPSLDRIIPFVNLSPTTNEEKKKKKRKRRTF